MDEADAWFARHPFPVPLISWDEAHELHSEGEDVPTLPDDATRWLDRPFAPHVDRLPRNPDEAALLVHDIDEALTAAREEES